MAYGDGQFRQQLRSFLVEPQWADRETVGADEVARRRAMSDALLGRGLSTAPVTSVFEGANRVLQAFLGGRGNRQADNAASFMRDRDEHQTVTGGNAMVDYIDQRTGQAPTPPQTFDTTYNPGTQSEWNPASWPGGGTVPGSTGGRTTPATPVVTYDYGDGTVRNQPVSGDLENVLNTAAAAAGIDSVVISSGGQPSAAEGGQRTGSTRHDDGGAADLQLVVGGRTLDFTNPADRPLIEAFVSAAHAAGATGIGAGTDYMGNNTLHVGFGPAAVWGAEGSSANAPDWLVAATAAPASVNPRGQGVSPLISAMTGIPQGSGGVPANAPDTGFIRQLIANPATRAYGLQLAQDQITALTAPPAAPVTVAENAALVDPTTGAEVYRNTGAPDTTAPRTETIMGPDGQRHIMAWNPATGQFDRDMGVGPPPANLYENTWDRLTAEQQGKVADDIYGGEQTGLNQLQNFDAMEQLINTPNFYSGSGNQLVQGARRLGVMLGLTDADTVASTEAFSGLAAQAALDAMGGSLGAGFSNADRDFIERTMPNLAFTPDGNRAVIAIHRAIAQRKIEIAQMLRDAGGRPTPEFMRQLTQYSLDNPLFAGGIPGVTTSSTPPAGATPPAPGGATTQGGTVLFQGPNGTMVRALP